MPADVVVLRGAGASQQLEDLLLNPILARSLGTAGRKAVVEKFRVESMAQEMVKAIQEVL